MPEDIAIVILAGGEASRFPNKLAHVVDGEPMIVRVYRNARALGWPIIVAARRPFGSGIDALLDCPIARDRWPEMGPLGGLASACSIVEQKRVFALAADMPRVDGGAITAVTQAWQPGDEVVLPSHPAGVEPLAALYDRAALVREAAVLLAHGPPSMHALVRRLKTRFIELPQRYFVNVNTPQDAAALGSFA
jgi:molybdenum cofactor guanylyltransferase